MEKVTSLSLYSTVTQNHLRWVLALAYNPNATILHWEYQHVGIKNAKICIHPTPTPNASRWKIGGVGSPTRGLVLAMYI